jgi:competence protein ComEA
VYVVGEVEEPGIFEVEDGTRVYEVLEMAGGVSQDADTARMNLAKIVVDEEKINVPKKVMITEESKLMDDGGLININTANADKLSTLNGIGKSTANKIIQYRNENGYFDTIEDIMKVTGIGESKFNAIKENITI